MSVMVFDISILFFIYNHHPTHWGTKCGRRGCPRPKWHGGERPGSSTRESRQSGWCYPGWGCEAMTLDTSAQGSPLCLLITTTIGKMFCLVIYSRLRCVYFVEPIILLLFKLLARTEMWRAVKLWWLLQKGDDWTKSPLSSACMISLQSIGLPSTFPFISVLCFYFLVLMEVIDILYFLILSHPVLSGFPLSNFISITSQCCCLSYMKALHA